MRWHFYESVTKNGMHCPSAHSALLFSQHPHKIFHCQGKRGSRLQLRTVFRLDAKRMRRHLQQVSQLGIAELHAEGAQLATDLFQISLRRFGMFVLLKYIVIDNPLKLNQMICTGSHLNHPSARAENAGEFLLTEQRKDRRDRVRGAVGNGKMGSSRGYPADLLCA